MLLLLLLLLLSKKHLWLRAKDLKHSQFRISISLTPQTDRYIVNQRQLILSNKIAFNFVGWLYTTWNLVSLLEPIILMTFLNGIENFQKIKVRQVFYCLIGNIAVDALASPHQSHTFRKIRKRITNAENHRRSNSKCCTRTKRWVNIWSSGYGRRLVFERSLVHIPPMHTRWLFFLVNLM